MNNLNEVLIQKLTWALVEISTPNGKPSFKDLETVLELALTQAILTKEAANRLQESFIRTVGLVGQPAEDAMTLRVG